MKFSKALFILLPFLCLSFCLRAQSHDVDGYYINLKGDTVSGKFIHYAEYSSSPESVLFELPDSINRTPLTPANCRKFVAGHDVYIAYQGKRLTNSTDFQNAAADRTDIYEDVSLFIRQLFNDGHYQLYELKDKKRSNFFISGDTTRLQELYYKEYIEPTKNTGVQDRVVESPVFKEQLTGLFMTILNNNIDLQLKIQKVHYMSNDLTDLFSIMTTGKIEKVKNKYPAQLIVGFGASSNSMNVTGSNALTGVDESDVVGTYSSQTSPLFEAGVKLFSQRNYGRLFFMLRANYYTFKNSHDHTDVTAGNALIRTAFKGTVLSFPVSIGYKIVNSDHFSIDLSAGASLLLLSNNTENQITNPGAGQTSNTFDDNKSTAFSFFGEAAVVIYKRVSVYTGYYSPASIAGFTNYDPDHSSLRYGVRLIF